MTEIQGTIGNIQLKKLSFIINENKKRFQAFDKNLSKNLSEDIYLKIPNQSMILILFL